MYKLMGYESQSKSAIKYLITDTDDGITELMHESDVMRLLKSGVYIKGLRLGKTYAYVDDYSEVVKSVEQFALDAPKIMSKLKLSGVESAQIIYSLKRILKGYGLIPNMDTFLSNFKLGDGSIYLMYQKADIHYIGSVRMSYTHTAYGIDVEWFTSGNKDKLTCVYADLLSRQDTVADYIRELSIFANKSVSTILAYVGIHVITGNWCVITKDGTLYDFSICTMRQAEKLVGTSQEYANYIAQRKQRGVVGDLAHNFHVIKGVTVQQMDSSLSLEDIINTQYYDKLKNVFVDDYIDKDKLTY